MELPKIRSTGRNSTATSTATAATVKKAVNNAASIVSSNAGLQDYDKLKAYNDRIQALSDYNTPATLDSWPYEYGNAWQLIWVFDGDPSTMVTSEGFARAFQYLCDLSTFNGNVVCYTVNGTVYLSSSSSDHRWNMVTMPEAFNADPESMYYKTDHHWTLQGAYQAYLALADRLGYEPLPLESFRLSEYSGFKGTTLSRSGLPAVCNNTAYLFISQTGPAFRHMQDSSARVRNPSRGHSPHI